MYKKLVFIAIFMMAFVHSFALQANESDTIVTDTVAAVENTVVKHTDVSPVTSFENYTDSLLLTPYEDGSFTLDWSSSGLSGKYVQIKYRELHAAEWTSSPIMDASAGKMSLDSIPENKIFAYYLGTGTTKSSISFETDVRYFNTVSPFIFSNNLVKSKDDAAVVQWAIPFNQLTDILSVYPNSKYYIKYNTKIGKKQNKADKDASPWFVTDPISIDDVTYKLDDVSGGTNYVYYVGLQLTEESPVIWSKEGKFKPKRSWGIFKLLVLIGALGMFIFGMKIMSEGLQKAAGSRLRNMLASITSNRIKGVFTGFGITSIVQSSSVTTVMTVSFVNAGLLTLRQSAGVMMGANIGTTITAWLILLLGFKVSLADYALIFIAFGAPLMFFSKGKAKTWSAVIIGFSLLFMGLDFLKDTVPTLGPESAIVQFFVDFKSEWYGPLMFVGLGALVTVVIQSSSAAMALTMTLVGGGVIPFEVASAMILGENIGTTITAEIASLIGNVHAKRSARIHSLFNLIGVTWAILLFPFILKGIALLIDGDPYTEGGAANMALAIFHTSFNALNVIILLPFVPWLVRVAERTVKSKGSEDEEFHLDYIGSGIMGTPDLSILEAKKEVAKFGEITSRMSRFVQQIMQSSSKKDKGKLHEKIAKYEEITDRVEVEVASYLAKVSEGEMSEETAQRVRAMNSIVNDLERIGDIFYQISKAIERKDEHKIWFMPQQRTSLMEMLTLVDNAFSVMTDNLSAEWHTVKLDKAQQAEQEINQKRDQMRTEHLQNLGKPDFNMESGMIFNNLFSSCEKVGDHIINVTEAITGRI